MSNFHSFYYLFQGDLIRISMKDEEKNFFYSFIVEFKLRNHSFRKMKDSWVIDLSFLFISDNYLVLDHGGISPEADDQKT